jgi:hypothetical protein
MSAHGPSPTRGLVRSALFLGAPSPFVAGCSAAAITTVQRDTEAVAAFLAGFVAAEGCFSRSGNGRRFTFEVGLGRADRGMCEQFHAWLRVGHIYDGRRRMPHHDDSSTFMVQSLRELVGVIVPFMDAHLPPSYKQEQYGQWREQLLYYWEHHARRVRRCSVEGCAAPQRAHGLCRAHLYIQYGM